MTTPKDKPSQSYASYEQVDLSQPEPEFLSYLDSDVERAASGFHRYAHYLFLHAPPQNYFKVAPDDRDDVFSEIVLSCLENDCAKLKMYQPRPGAKFSGWFAVVASRKISDFLKHQRSRATVSALETEVEPPTSAPTPEQVVIAQEMERIFLSSLRELGRRCRLLLRLRMLEFKNREIVKVLRLPKNQNKTVGNQIVECRKKLKRSLRRAGFFSYKHELR